MQSILVVFLEICFSFASIWWEWKLTSLNSATCFCENIENTFEPARFARLDEVLADFDDWRVEPDGDFGVAAEEAAGVAAGVSSGVASTVESPSLVFFFFTFFSFSD